MGSRLLRGDKRYSTLVCRGGNIPLEIDRLSCILSEIHEKISVRKSRTGFWISSEWAPVKGVILPKFILIPTIISETWS